MRKRIIETWKPMKAAAYAAHRAVCDKENELLKPLNSADQLLRTRIGAYTYEQLRLAQVEDEKNRLQAEAEARERARRETDENALAAAEELEAMGDHEAAEAVLESPLPAPIRYDMPMPVRPAVANVEGVSGAITYEVTTTLRPCAAAAAGHIPASTDRGCGHLTWRSPAQQAQDGSPSPASAQTFAAPEGGGVRRR